MTAAAPEADVIATVDGLGKDYGSHKAVDSLSFELRSGEVFGLLGPNGAGKTSVVEIGEGTSEVQRMLIARDLGLSGA